MDLHSDAAQSINANRNLSGQGSSCAFIPNFNILSGDLRAEIKARNAEPVSYIQSRLNTLAQIIADLKLLEKGFESWHRYNDHIAHFFQTEYKKYMPESVLGAKIYGDGGNPIRSAGKIGDKSMGELLTSLESFKLNDRGSSDTIDMAETVKNQIARSGKREINSILNVAKRNRQQAQTALIYVQYEIRRYRNFQSEWEYFRRLAQEGYFSE